MPSTYSKFENARILLEQAVNSGNEQNKVRANLDAFVTTARSITLVMQKEFSKNPKFKEWYESITKDMKNDEIFQFFINLRNVSVHEKTVANTFRISTTYEKGLTLKNGDVIPFGKVGKDGNMILADPNIIIRDGKKINPGVNAHTNIEYFFGEKPDTNAFELCSLYLRKLEKIVMECYNKFSPPKKN